MELIINLNLDNQAMQDDLATELRTMIETIIERQDDLEQGVILYDSNGNRVGNATMGETENQRH